MDWVFLIQREGARTWQPIQTPILEVEECRYRIIGQTNVTNLSVEVRVIGTPFEALSISECRQTYFRRTNSEGLIIILPFTYFFAGLWKLSCCCDAMSELMGENWRVSQQIFSVPKAGYLEFTTAYIHPCIEKIEFNLPKPIQSHHTPPLSSSIPKVLPPKLNPTSEKVVRKSPQLPKFFS